MDEFRPKSPLAITNADSLFNNNVPSSGSEVSQGGASHAVALNKRQNQLPQQSSQSLSRVERLPFELRHMIYTHLFSNDRGEPAIKIELVKPTRFRVPGFGTVRALSLTNRQISSEIKVFFFQVCKFHLCDNGFGCMWAVITFKIHIGSKNTARVRKIALPALSIGRTANMDCSQGLSELKFAVRMLAFFSSLRQVCIGLEMIECLPHGHELFHPTENTTKGSLMLWNWRSVAQSHPMRQVFNKFKQCRRLNNVDVSIYWTEFLLANHLPSASQQLYETVKADYRAQFLVVLHEWLGVRSLRAVKS
jgi:hypothetical protein